MITKTVQHFYNKKKDQYCILEAIKSGDRYMAYGEPQTLKQLADLGWRRTTATKFDSAQFDKHLDTITVTGDNKIYKKRERKVSRNLGNQQQNSL